MKDCWMNVNEIVATMCKSAYDSVRALTTRILQQ